MPKDQSLDNSTTNKAFATSSQKRRVTVRDVARYAKVSVGTVSNVFNDPSMVKPSTKKRVLEAIEATGFVRNTAASQLRGGSSKVVGIVILDSSNPFFTELMRGAEDTLRQHGYILIACSTNKSSNWQSQYLRLLEEHRVEGILITPADDDIKSLEKLRDRGIPVVLLDREAGLSKLCSVTVDDIKGGQLAMSHLLETGHRKIIIVNGPSSIRQCYNRKLGLKKAIENFKHVESVELLELPVPSLTIAAGEQIAKDIIYQEGFTAIMCGNDLIAIGILRTLIAHDVAVPDRFSIIGYDDITFASMLSPSLTSIHQPQYDLGVAAANLLLEELSDTNHKHKDIRFIPDLVVRASSRSILDK